MGSSLVSRLENVNELGNYFKEIWNKSTGQIISAQLSIVKIFYIPIKQANQTKINKT